MTKKIVRILSLTVFIVLLNFEFRLVREMERTHYGWYCFLSFNVNKQTTLKPGGYFDREFKNVFISSEKIEEIRDQVSDILEREDDDETNSNTVDPADNYPSEF